MVPVYLPNPDISIYTAAGILRKTLSHDSTISKAVYSSTGYLMALDLLGGMYIWYKDEIVMRETHSNRIMDAAWNPKENSICVVLYLGDLD